MEPCWRSSENHRPGTIGSLARLAVACLLPLSALADQTVSNRVGQGDPRDGYGSVAYQTQSRSLETLTGSRADLASLAARPPLGLPELPDPPSAGAIDLGRRLFFDRRLSRNATISCGMCHIPEQAFTQNELATPVGIEGAFVRRNAPALYNVAYRRLLFHDGRETELRRQIWAPLLAANEMGNASKAAVLTRLASNPEYSVAFERLFEDGLTESTLGQALAAYQGALLSANSAFDRWYFGGEFDAITPSAKRGFLLFNQSGCAGCHTFSNRHAFFTNDAMHRTGIEFLSRQRESAPPGRLQIAPGVTIPVSVSITAPRRHDTGFEETTGNVDDRWRYRTPSLRNAAITAPYMHDGSLATLSEVVNFYNAGAGPDPGKESALSPLHLTDEQQLDLIEFLESLTGDNVDELAADARSAPIGDRQSAIGDR